MKCEWFGLHAAEHLRGDSAALQRMSGRVNECASSIAYGHEHKHMHTKSRFWFFGRFFCILVDVLSARTAIFLSTPPASILRHKSRQHYTLLQLLRKLVTHSSASAVQQARGLDGHIIRRESQTDNSISLNTCIFYSCFMYLEVIRAYIPPMHFVK